MKSNRINRGKRNWLWLWGVLLLAVVVVLAMTNGRRPYASDVNGHDNGQNYVVSCTIVNPTGDTVTVRATSKVVDADTMRYHEAELTPLHQEVLTIGPNESKDLTFTHPPAMLNHKLVPRVTIRRAER